MRQAEPERRQAVLLDAGHLAEGARVSVGQERRIVAEAGGAARRPHQRAVDARLDLLEMTVGPGDAQRRDEMRLALVRRRRAALLQQAFDPRHRRGEILGRASPARRIDSGRAVERIDHEAGIVGKGRKLRGLRRGDRLDRGIGAKRSPVSSGSPRPSSPAETASTPCGASNSRISASLPGLWVAITSLPVIRRCMMRIRLRDGHLLQVHQTRRRPCAPAPSAPGTRPARTASSRRCPAPR